MKLIQHIKEAGIYEHVQKQTVGPRLLEICTLLSAILVQK